MTGVKIGLFTYLSVLYKIRNKYVPACCVDRWLLERISSMRVLTLVIRHVI